MAGAIDNVSAVTAGMTGVGFEEGGVVDATGRAKLKAIGPAAVASATGTVEEDVREERGATDPMYGMAEWTAKGADTDAARRDTSIALASESFRRFQMRSSDSRDSSGSTGVRCMGTTLSGGRVSGVATVFFLELSRSGVVGSTKVLDVSPVNASAALVPILVVAIAEGGSGDSALRSGVGGGTTDGRGGEEAVMMIGVDGTAGDEVVMRRDEMGCGPGRSSLISSISITRRFLTSL